MKKATLIITLLIVVCTLFSCNMPKPEANASENSIIEQKVYTDIYETVGIENFNKFDGPSEMNIDILPSDDFIENFEYVDAQYVYRECYEGWWDVIADEKSIVVIKYDESNYMAAKEFCLNEMNLSETYTLQYNNYVFKENVATAIRYCTYSDDGVHSFPQRFNMVAYNDNLNTLVFFGCFFSGYTDKDAMFIISQWGEFLNIHFSDVYSFDGNQSGEN